jgi:exosortase
MSFPSPILPANRSPLPQPTPDAVSAQSPPRAVAEDEGMIEGVLRRAREFVSDMQSPEQRVPWIVIAMLSALLFYSYWPSLVQLPSFWDNPQYQHGWIVPVFTTLLIFWWRKPVGPVTQSARAAGVGLLVASFALRLFCASYRIVTIDMYTFVPALMGVFLLAGGWSMFRWSWAPLASLIFMYPLPDEATRYLLGPLQTVATIVSSYMLQTIGLDAYRDGNRIILGDGQVLGVVDACSGLKMLTIFVWLAVMLMLVGGLEWWENLAIAASAIPIALVCNAFRITTVGVMYNYKMSIAEHFHDSTPAAMLMMLLAVGFLVLEMKILSYLVVTDTMAPTMLAAGQRQTAVAANRPGERSGQAVQPVVAGPRPASPQPQSRQSGAFPSIPMGNFPEKRPSSLPPDGGEKMG